MATCERRQSVVSTVEGEGGKGEDEGEGESTR